jgi:hypothetical protein
LFVWNLYKSTFLNRYKPNFAHIFPLGLEEVVGYVWTHNNCFYSRNQYSRHRIITSLPTQLKRLRVPTCNRPISLRKPFD